jgi:hypothetical protein
MKNNNTKWTQKKNSSKNASVTTTKAKTTKNEATTKINKILKNGKYAKELTFGAQVSVKALSFDLHMARAREIPY